MDSKDPAIHVLDRHTQHASSTKTECDYLNGWIKKNGHIRKNLTKNGEIQRYTWGTQKKTVMISKRDYKMSSQWYQWQIVMISTKG